MVTTRLDTALLDLLPERIAKGALEVTLAGATATVQAARAAVEEIHGTGIQYPNLPNQSSAPGQAPQDQRGSEGLLGTIRTDQDDVQGIGADAIAGDGSGQATALEGGTSNIEPRPFMEPASLEGKAAAEKVLVTVGKSLGST